MGAPEKTLSKETTTSKLRFVVGSSKAAYVNGKSKMSMATLDIQQARKTLEYYEQMAMGEVVVFELVPVTLEPDGSVTRQT